MLKKQIDCRIVSAEEHIFDGSIAMLIATAAEGELGILPNHTPLLTQLVPGPIRLVLSQEKEEIFYVSGGFIEVQPHMILVLADTVLRTENIDAEAIERTKNQALQSIQNSDQDTEFDYSLAKSTLAESLAQLRTIKKLNRKSKKLQ